MFVDTQWLAEAHTEYGDAKNYHEMPSGIFLNLDYNRFFSTVNTFWKFSSNIFKVSMMGNIFLYKKYLKLDIVSSSVLAHHPFRSPAPRLQRALCWAEWNERVSHQDKVSELSLRKGLWGGCLLETAAGPGLQSHTVRRSRSYCSLVLSAFHVLSSSPVLTGRLRRPEALVFGQPRCLACF